jgi:hypothetical protein
MTMMALSFTTLPSITNNRILIISSRDLSHSTTNTRNPSTLLPPPPLTTSITSSTHPSSSRLQLSATITRDELSTMSKAEQYHLLGVESENQLALGIDVDDVLEYIGTKSDILTKFSTDLPHLATATNIEQEVNKFLLDGEMLDVMIKYEQRKRTDPSWDPSSQYSSSKGGNESPINTVINFVAQYGVYVVGAILVKDVVEGIMNKYNAGGG